MSTNCRLPIIASVWRFKDMAWSVSQAAQRTGTRAIFDLTSVDLGSAESAIVRADIASNSSDVKISPNQLLDTSLEAFLLETGITGLWVELHPASIGTDPMVYLDRMVELSSSVRCYPVVGDVGLIMVLLSRSNGPVNMALKGSEAGGFGSGENIFTLYSAAAKTARETDRPVNLIVWGGIAVPEAAAAFLAAGAAGIVFESVHWLTDLVSADDAVKGKLSGLRMEHTDLVGLNLNVPCRFFNRGNSRAVRRLRDFAKSLCGAEITPEQQRAFAERIRSEAVDPLDSSFSADELIPLGIEATFAESFVKRFGSSTEQALDRFVGEIDRLCRRAHDKIEAFARSKTAREMGTTYPFVQGAMSWITDVPRFAVNVAEAGALPTIAMGLLPRDVIDVNLAGLREAMGDRPFAVNVITLQENPNRDEQLAWIRDVKPRFAVIAAGEPSHARALLDQGIEVIYIAPNEELLKLAFDVGVRFIVCEGNEGGGHVGEHSTVALAQMILDLKHRYPSMFEGRHIILAGGICNRQTAFMAAMLGADAVQMGTCYLTTKEIVETGALTELYQRMILESKPGSTAVTGERTGLRVRSLRTSKIDAICVLERDYSAATQDEAEFRQRMEHLSAGSLLIAARGLTAPDGAPVDERTCIEQGQFMSGACAGTLNTIRTLSELHSELAESSLPEGLPFAGPVRESTEKPPVFDVEEAVPSGAVIVTPRVAHSRPERERIAITGMSIVNSLGNSPEEIWAGSLALKSGVINVPESRWDHEILYDPHPRTPEKTYCKVGAFQNIEVSRKDLGIPPQDFRTMTDSTRISMWLAKRALGDSGILLSNIPRDRISVLSSQNSGEAAATLEDVIVTSTLHKIVKSIRTVLPLTDETAKALQEAIKSNRIVIDDTTLLGRLNCTSSGFICNKYGFMGPSFAVSAACATALVALYSAYQMIRNGIIDAALVGGAEEPLTETHFLEFSALGALAGISGADRPPEKASRPFDANRDGMVLGEGGAMIVIERESVARARGARIYGYITGMGASNNHLGMVESSRASQELAIGASLNDAPYGPDDVDLVECHATSTLQGDVEEVLALRSFYGSGAPTVLTSFKSQIGHTLGASGFNSVVRALMAMNAGIFPATINYETPDPSMHLDGSGLRILREPDDWLQKDGEPRRFEVNAFGFGGSNYVVQLEQALDSQDAVLVTPGDYGPREATQISAPASHGGVRFFRTEIGRQPYRLAVVAESEDQAVSLIRSIQPVRGIADLSGKFLRTLVKQGVFLASEKDRVPRAAFVFPGQGSHYAGMGLELYETFPVIREWMDRASEVAEFDLLHLLFHDREEDLQKTRWQQPALFTLEYSMARYLWSLGFRPDAMAGHSLGELTALCLAGVYSFEDGFRIVNMRAICMDKACQMNADPGVMMAVDAPLDYLEERLRAQDKIFITNINSPKQMVIGGDTEAVRAFGEDLKELGYRRTLLRVSMAFHSPIMRCIHDELEAFVSEIEFHGPVIPVISNTTKKPFPEDTAEIKRILMAHLESPVHWMENVRTLWNEYDVRLFLEVGPRDILGNMIRDIYEDAECIHTCLPSAEKTTLASAVARLYTAGRVVAPGRPRQVEFPGQQKTVARPVGTQRGSVSAPAAPAVPPAGFDRVVHDRILDFVRDGFGRFLRPALLEALRTDLDPGFSEQDLDSALGLMFPNIAGRPLPGPRLSSAAQPAAERVRSAQGPTPAGVPPESPGTDEILEAVIGIIVDATGYERDEIEPQMDLRDDLSIRSSRLPVIMEALERRFEIKIRLEDFMEVRTVDGIADKLREIVGVRPKSARRSVEPSGAEEAITGEPEEAPIAESRRPITRVVFAEVPMEPFATQPIDLSESDGIVIASADINGGLADRVAALFREDYRVNTVRVPCLEGGRQGSDVQFDLRVAADRSKAAESISRIQSPAGLVFIIDESFGRKLSSMEEVSTVLTGCFTMVKAFLRSEQRKFMCLLHKADRSDSPDPLLVQGLLGMFLSLAHEYSSVQFRTIGIEEKTDLRYAVRLGLDRGLKVVEIACRNGQVFVRDGQPAPLTFRQEPEFELGSNDVVVLSGGGRGITTYLARSIAPLGCRIVFLGRTSLDPALDYEQILESHESAEDAIRRALREARPELGEQGMQEHVAESVKALEIVRNVEELRRMGVEASYYRCDVTNPETTDKVIGTILRRYGKADAVVHGAGILKDSLAKDLTEEDFAAAVDAKFLGAWNLFKSVENASLRFFACLSSGASIQGNPGQSNYAAGNRMMSALMSYLRRQKPSIRFKAFQLPPIEGAGMAENPEIRALMKMMNAEYLHVKELGEIFAREVLMGSSEDDWVLFMRSLPDLPTVRIRNPQMTPVAGILEAASVRFMNENFPMIDSVAEIDLRTGRLKAARTFSHEKDLWLADHKPLKFIKHPIVSAIMAVETFMEAARLLYPHLCVRGIRNVKFRDIIECPSGAEREVDISCARAKVAKHEVVCDVSMVTRELASMSQSAKRAYANFEAQVILGPRGEFSLESVPGFPVRQSDLDAGPLNRSEVIERVVRRSDLQGRYLVLEEMEGKGTNAVRGSTIYRHEQDFAAPPKSGYQYSPYLLEALMHAANMYLEMGERIDNRSTIPHSIGEMLFTRKCQVGERLILEGRLKRNDDQGMIWDARAVDSAGQTVMLARDIVMRWFLE